MTLQIYRKIEVKNEGKDGIEIEFYKKKNIGAKRNLLDEENLN